MKNNTVKEIENELMKQYERVNQTPSLENLLALSNTYSRMGAYCNRHGEYSEAKKCYLKGQIIRRTAKSNYQRQNIIGNNTHPWIMEYIHPPDDG